MKRKDELEGEKVLSVDGGKYRYEYAPIYKLKLWFSYVSGWLIGFVVGFGYFLIYSFFYVVGLGCGFWGVLKLTSDSNVRLETIVGSALGLIK